ncbi:DUF6343 family protein, partial [Nonomuraea sp. NPDC049784]|uniref:DUF6343 family protein n=1 Tax=Nonomuraea sp. NPDC049784 TaxID=3154361 RepID=UPI0033DC5DBD
MPRVSSCRVERRSIMWLRNRAGTEPLTARSPLGARRILSLVALVLGVAAAVFFALRAASTGAE